MKIQEAHEKVLKMIEERATRSKVCSFLNELAAAGLITEGAANDHADVLDMAKENNMPVMKALERFLSKKRNEELAEAEPAGKD